MRYVARLRAALWLPAALCLPAAIAVAGSFSVNPVRVTLSAGRPVASLAVHNTGAQIAVVQIEASSWSQHDSETLLTPTHDILATPPIVTIAPGGTQFIRVGLRRPQDPARELPYRLVLRDLPSSDSPSAGLQMRLAISVPVFVSPPGASAPSVAWSAHRTADGVRLQALNTGNAHVQVSHFELIQSGTGERLAASEAPAYLLPGDRREWLLKPESLPTRAQPVRLSAKTDAGEQEVELDLAASPDPGAALEPSSSISTRGHESR